MKRLTSCFAPGLFVALTACGTLLTACGTLSDGEDPALLATIQGQLTNAQSIDTPSTIRVAVLWQSAQQGGGGFSVAQEVEVEPVFPSKFKLALTSAPPEAAMLTPGEDHDDGSGPDTDTPAGPDDGDGTGGFDPGASGGTTPGGGTGPTPMELDLDDGPTDMRLGFGFLVAYEDTNGNGKLDLVDNDATAFVDRILGANPELMVLYAEGNVNHPELVDPHGTALKLGYNLFKFHPCFETYEADVGGADAAPACTPEAAWLPIDSLYDLPITSDPEFSSLMCKDPSSGGSEVSEQGGGSYPGQQPEGTDPGPAGYPAASEVACDADGKAYRHNECVYTDHGPCRGTSSNCTVHYIGLPTGNVPAGWPCTL